MTDKRVLTFQDISCMGQCSITVAQPIISACGIETIILPSAVLSTHTGGFTGFTVRDLSEDIPGIINHWQQENLLFDCLYTGYLGSLKALEYAKDLRNKVIQNNGQFIVDPAMADNGNLYYGFDAAYVDAMAKLCGEADIILPNITEAAFMTGSKIILNNHTPEYIEQLLEKLSALGPKIVVLKGILYEEDRIGVAVYDCAKKKVDYYFTTKINKNFHGTGDCYAASFTGALMQGYSAFDAAKIAADFVGECIKKTINDDSHWYGVKFEKALPMLVSLLNC